LGIVIHLSNQRDTLARALQETIPAGWQAIDVSDLGEVDRVHNQVKWGPFTNPAPLTVSYKLVPPLTATGRVRLSGVASCDGMSRPIDGDAELRAASRLAWRQDQNGSPLALQLETEPDSACVIETSTDLVSWITLLTVTNCTGAVEVPVKADGPQRFYRVRPAEWNLPDYANETETAKQAVP
jgi:hypothetical protein